MTFMWREIVIEGVAFDVDEALRASGLRPESLWHRGKTREGWHAPSQTSGLRIEYTPANEFAPVAEDSDEWRYDPQPNARQFEDAVACLRSADVALRIILARPGIDRAVLSFELALRPRRVAEDHRHLLDVLPTFDDFRPEVPPEVVQLAGDLGLSIALNVNVIEDWGWEFEGLGGRGDVLHHGRSIEISGTGFDPDGVPRAGLPKPDYMWRRGAPMPGFDGRRHGDGGVSYDVAAMDRTWQLVATDPGDAVRYGFDVAPPHRQFEDAAEFLTCHAEALQRVAALPGVERRMLHLAVPLAPDGVPADAGYDALLKLPALDMLDMTLPATLIRRMGELGLGVRVTMYPVAYWRWPACGAVIEPPEEAVQGVVAHIVEHQPDFVMSRLLRVYGASDDRDADKPPERRRDA